MCNLFISLTLFILLSLHNSPLAFAQASPSPSPSKNEEVDQYAHLEDEIRRLDESLSNRSHDQEINYDFCGQLGWLNNNYCYLNYGVSSTAKTINNWFKHEGGDSTSPATTRGRLRFGWEPRSGDLSEIDFRFKIRVKLPALEDRVELLFSDEEDDVGQQAVKASRDAELNGRDQAVVALQFKNKQIWQ